MSFLSKSTALEMNIALWINMIFTIPRNMLELFKICYGYLILHVFFLAILDSQSPSLQLLYIVLENHDVQQLLLIFSLKCPEAYLYWMSGVLDNKKQKQTQNNRASEVFQEINKPIQ